MPRYCRGYFNFQEQFMNRKFSAGATFAFLLPLFAIDAQAADCDGNFSTSGNILTGKSYKTLAELPGVNADTAYQAAFVFIAKQGFIIQQSDSAARVISALNNTSAPGRPAPLNATIEPSQTGATISLNFATPAGAFAPENTIKDEFCKIVRAAAVPRAEAGPTEPVQAAARTGDNANASGRSDTGTGRVCLANACIGMSLEEAARLDLKPRSTKYAANVNFRSTRERAGHYGLDANGKLVAITSLAVDKAWIREFGQTIRTMCAVSPQISAEISASDGMPINLVFFLKKQNGKIQYVLSSITRLFPGNMSASERRNFENEVRNRYGRAFVENGDIARAIKANNGQLQEPAVMINPAYLELRGPGSPDLASQLMEQPGCSNRVRLD
jgi:hypothetical protein